ncbi:MAG UNVERIFIED_CONTAM: hypothetical protein LVR29_22500 [Microcystis novacekii LVE1205-3]
MAEQQPAVDASGAAGIAPQQESIGHQNRSVTRRVCLFEVSAVSESITRRMCLFKVGALDAMRRQFVQALHIAVSLLN